MSEHKEGADEPKPGDVDNIRDLSDFCVKWDGLRGFVSDEALDEGELSPETAEVVRWLRRLADRTMSTL